MIEPILSDDKFLADVAAQHPGKDAFCLWWLGQSGYLLRHDNLNLLIDPYLSESLTTKYATTDKPHIRMTRRVIDPARLSFVDVLTSSHNHTDHLDAETINPIFAANKNLKIVIPETNRAFAGQRLGISVDRFTAIIIGQSLTLGDLRIIAVPAAHDQLLPQYVGYVFRVGPWTIYHSGDTVIFDGMADILRPHKIDVAILPINGKVGNMNGKDAANLAKQIGARVVIPCHYEMFEFNTASPEEFIAECDHLKQSYKVLRAGERFNSQFI